MFNDGTATEVTGPDNLVMSGTLNKIEGGNNVTVTNKYVAPETTTLTIDKVVEGEAPFDKEFEFTITFTALEGFENMKVQKADGTEVNYGEAIPFNLTNGTNIQFKEIPVGVTYVLTEAGVVHYTPSYSTSSGKSGSDTSGADLTTESIEILTGENTITVTNTYSDTVPTGVTIHGEMIAIVLLVLVAMAGSFILTRKMRRA